MSTENPEVLYVLEFSTGRQAERFVTDIRRALESPDIRRKTAATPLAIYGRLLLGEERETSVFVTAGILTTAALIASGVRTAGKIVAGAQALPPWAVTLLAEMADER